MPTLDFRGKSHIYAHHLSVPYRPLVPDIAKSHGDNFDKPDDNLIIHGDNLEALKALLPRYAGRVNCIYIDPPYNTGNEGWIYNDKVNSPLMREWIARNGVVDGEDLERHDKWLCMMWPRLQLLKRLLADDGVFFTSIDEHEEHHYKIILDEIFGETNFLNSISWISNLKGRQLRQTGAARTHETILAYCKEVKNLTSPWRLDVETATRIMPNTYQMAEYHQHLDDKGPYVIKNQLHNTNSKFNEETAPTLVFNIHYRPDPLSVKFTDAESAERFPSYDFIPPKSNNDGTHRYHAWRWSRQKIQTELQELHFEKPDDSWRIFTKVRDFKTTQFKDLITNLNGNGELKQLGIQFPSPKPCRLPQILIEVSSKPDAIVLDSFAGSGTTAHAVLSMNQADGGNRKFILVECESYADTITAERVRRVIDGVPGAKDKRLRSGLGGSFTYCTLGEPVEVEQMLTGEALPAYSDLAAYLLHTSSGITLQEAITQNADHLIYSDSSTSTDYYLLYEPDVDWLRSNEAMLTQETASNIAQHGNTAVVFAAGKYMTQQHLTYYNIVFCQIPYELYRGN